MNNENLEVLDYIIDFLEDVYKKVKDGDNNFAITALIAYGEEDEGGVHAKGYETTLGDADIAAFANAKTISKALTITDKIQLLSNVMVIKTEGYMND